MDLTFKTDNGRFNYRVGAILIKDGKVLVVKNELSAYYYSVGGRVHFDETTKEAVKREVKEELGIDLEIERPVFFHEQFFDEVDSKEHFHEISIYYLMKQPNDDQEMVCTSVSETGNKEVLCWLPIDQLENYTVFPSFFAKELVNLPEGIKFITSCE